MCEHPPGAIASAEPLKGLPEVGRRAQPSSPPPLLSPVLGFASKAAQSGVPWVRGTGLETLFGRQNPLFHEGEA